MNTVYIVGKKGGFDVSSLIHDLTYTTSLDGQAGKLTFQLERDPNGILNMSVGNRVLFLDDDGNRVFTGNIFTLGTDRTEAYSVTAYDSLRYLQNHDYLFLDGEEVKSAQDVFVKICTQMGIAYSIKVPATTPLTPHLFVDESYYEMLNHCLTELNEKTESYFFIRDRAGVLELNEIEKNFDLAWGGNPVVIGDKSLLTDYKYEVDIDKNTFNEVYLMESVKSDSQNKDAEKTDKRLFYAKQDTEGVAKWGTLRKIVNVKEQATEEELKDYANLFLSVYSKPDKTMRIEALGYPVYAGDGVQLVLDKLGINFRVYVKSATHNYGEVHTMTLDVSTCQYYPDETLKGED